MASKQLKSQTSKVKSEEKKLNFSSTSDSLKSKPSKTPQTMEELIAMTGYTLKGVKKGDIVEGKVSYISPKEVRVDIGSKTEGVIIDRELETYRDVIMKIPVGDTVVAQVIVAENDRGQAVLSIRRSLTKKHWDDLAILQKNGEPVEIIIKDPVRGGVLVDYGGLRGYIPQSQLDSSLLKQLDKASGRRIKVKVIEVDQETNRLVFSQRAITDEAALTKQKELLDIVPVGESVAAIISGVVPFGAFAKFTIEKDGEKHDIEGLIHISEIAWEKVEDLNQYVTSGQSMKVKVIGIDAASGKVTLSLKQLLPDPWEHVLDMFENEAQVKGKVTRVSPYGVFVTLGTGIEGLIHTSKLISGEEPKVGDEITCIVEEIKAAERKISLSMALKEKPIGYR